MFGEMASGYSMGIFRARVFSFSFLFLLNVLGFLLMQTMWDPTERDAYFAVFLSICLEFVRDIGGTNDGNLYL